MGYIRPVLSDQRERTRTTAGVFVLYRPTMWHLCEGAVLTVHILTPGKWALSSRMGLRKLGRLFM